MQYFFGPPAKAEIRETDSYLEITSPIPDASLVSYVIKVEGTTWAACTCWEQRFDPIFQQLNNPQYGQIYLPEFKKIWPSFFRAYDNAVDEQYGNGALAEFYDPDDMNRKWFIASMFQASDLDQLNERMVEPVDRVLDLSGKVFLEFRNEVTGWQKAKMMAKGAAVGYRAGRQAAEPWEKGLDWLRVLAGQ